MSPNQDTINEFVGVAHGAFARVKAMLAADPSLLDARSSVDESAIEAAAQMGNVEIAEFLLSQGAPLDICTAAMIGLQEKVAQLLADDPTQAQAKGAHGFPALYFPVIRGHRIIAEMLLSAGADPNAGEGGMTPLHGAVMFGQAAMAQWLLDHGASPNPKNYEGKTPLEMAVGAGKEDIAAILQTAVGGK